MADIGSHELTPLTTGTSTEFSPVVSPDGKSILYDQDVSRSMWYRFPLRMAQRRPSSTLAITKAWLHGPQSRRSWLGLRIASGPWEIWVRLPDGSDRPAVTAADFPSGNHRIVHEPFPVSRRRPGHLRQNRSSGMDHRLWISSLSGGAPVRLTNTDTASSRNAVDMVA